MSEIDDVLAANRAYYDALSARDIETMTGLWTGTKEDINIAPPVKPVVLSGWNEIKANYLTYWESLAELHVAMESPEVRINGDTAWIRGVEVTRRRLGDGSTEGSHNAGVSIFVRRNGRWLMTFHQTTALT